MTSASSKAGYDTVVDFDAVGPIGSAPQAIEGGSAKETGLRVLCWNICIPPWGKLNIPHCKCSDQKRRRIKLMFEKIFAPYDVLLLHEVWGAWYSYYQTAFIAEAKRHGFQHIANDNSRYCCKLTDNGCMVLSKNSEITSSSVHRFRSTTGLQSSIPNGILHARMKLPSGGFVNLFTSHMHTGASDTALLNGPAKCKKVQLGQVTEIKEFIASETPEGEDWLFEGDLNVDSCIAEDPEKLNYPDVVGVMGESLTVSQLGSPSTYPLPKEGGRLVNPVCIGTVSCLDHVFTNIQSAAMGPVLFDELQVDGIWLSDHAAIDVTLYGKPN
jgi:hypothetical protein